MAGWLDGEGVCSLLFGLTERIFFSFLYASHVG